MRRTLTILLLATLTALPLLARADVYRSVDAQGHVKYSDTPSPGAVRVSTLDPRSDASDTAANDASSTSHDATPSTTGKDGPGVVPADPIAQRLAEQAAQRAVQRDTTDARAKQCKQATEAYQNSVQARRLYRSGADGERHYLSDSEAEQQRVKNRLAMQSACSDSP